MGVTRSNSGLFSTPGFVVSPVGKRERGEERENKKGRREKGNRKGGKEKKKSSAGFKPVRLVLLVVLSVQRQRVVGRIGFTFLPSCATLFTVVQPAVSPSPAAPLCWVFCLCPRELVGPVGLCVQVLGRHCRCGPWQAIRPLISQPSSFVLGTRASSGSGRLGFRKLASGFVLGKRASSRPCAWGADPAALGLSLSGGRGRPGTESRGTRFQGFGPVGGAASLCSR